MTHPTKAASAGQGESDVNGRPDSPQGACWDLDLLPPDDVCALLKAKKSWLWLHDTVEADAIEVIRLASNSASAPQRSHVR